MEEKKYIIDTDTWIEYFHHRSGVEEHLKQVPTTSLAVSEVTIAELYYGAIHSKDYNRHIKEPHWLEENIKIFSISDVLEDYAIIRQALFEKNYKNVGDFDILIGATARHFGLTVVTNNIKHFSQMPDVKIVNWVESK